MVKVITVLILSLSITLPASGDCKNCPTNKVGIEQIVERFSNAIIANSNIAIVKKLSHADYAALLVKGRSFDQANSDFTRNAGLPTAYKVIKSINETTGYFVYYAPTVFTDPTPQLPWGTAFVPPVDSEWILIVTPHSKLNANWENVTYIDIPLDDVFSFISSASDNIYGVNSANFFKDLQAITAFHKNKSRPLNPSDLKSGLGKSILNRLMNPIDPTKAVPVVKDPFARED